MKKVVCLISGRGSNLDALLRDLSARDHADRSFEVVGVLSNVGGVGGLDVARRYGVQTCVVPHRDFDRREGFDACVEMQLQHWQADIVVLAGFMRVLGASLISRYRGRMINVHPSLLPAFPGLHTHRRALSSGVRVHGATVHFVSEGVDEGPIVAQVAVPVRGGDDEQALAARVLAAEHRLLPDCVRWLADGLIELLPDGKVRTNGIEDAQRSRWLA